MLPSPLLPVSCTLQLRHRSSPYLSGLRGAIPSRKPFNELLLALCVTTAALLDKPSILRCQIDLRYITAAPLKSTRPNVHSNRVRFLYILINIFR